MFVIAAIAVFLALTAVFSMVRERAIADGATPRITARDIDAAGAAPQPGARDRHATHGVTLSGAPVPSWG